MAIYTGSPAFATTLLGEKVAEGLSPAPLPEPSIAPLVRAVFEAGRGIFHAPYPDQPWEHLLLTEYSSGSQYDELIELARSKKRLPDRIVCAAGSGRGFHGFKGRSWAAEPGNIHLSILLTPGRPIDRFQVAFTSLAAVSVVDAIDAVSRSTRRPGIKWVNDVLLGRAKVAGILAYTQTRDTWVTAAVLGIGLNVESVPRVEPTPFVPSVTSLRRAFPDCPDDLQRLVFQNLLHALDRNYRVLLERGFDPLLERYRERVVGMGEEITVCSEDSEESLRIVASGRIASVGDNLELHLEGDPRPLHGGRLVLGSVAPATLDRQGPPLSEGLDFDECAPMESGASTIPDIRNPD
jgi:BirA family biotin operon repressor/biotin-[acetyl-CoA-carboxylase] ligase